MKKKLVALSMSLIFIITGCQKQEEKLEKVDAVPLIAKEELVIPDRDRIKMKEETAWIVDQYKKESNLYGYIEEKELVITDEQGVGNEITKDYLSWKIIKKDGKESLYYVNSSGIIYCYEPQTKETTEIGGKGSSVNEADIQKDDVTGHYYVILKKYTEGSYYRNEITVLDLFSGEEIISDLSVLYGQDVIYDGKLYYTKELYTPSFEEYLSESQGMPLKPNDQINTYDLKTGEDSVFFNLEKFYKERNMLEKASKALGNHASCSAMYYESDHLLIRVDSEQDSGNWPRWAYDIYLPTGDIQPLGSEEGHHSLALSQDTLFIRNEKIYAITRYSDGWKSLEIFDLKAGQFCLNDQEFEMQTPLGSDEKYIYMYDSKEGSYTMNEIMANLKQNVDKFYKINIDTLKKEEATIEDIPLAKFERDDHYLHDAFEVKEGIFTQTISNGIVGLFKKGAESPFFTSQLDIVAFEKVNILSEQKLQLLSNTDAFTLTVGESKLIDYQVDQKDARLYFVSTHPEVARVDQRGKVTAGAVGSTHISIIAIKNGYKRDVKHIYVEVEGSGKVPLSLSTQLLLLKQGECAQVNYESLEGTDLNIVPDKGLVELKAGENGSLYVTGKEEGLEVLRFKASKDGYISQEVIVPIIIGIDNGEEVVSHLTQHWKDLRSEGIISEQNKEQVAREADDIMTLAYKKLETNNHTLHINKALLKELDTLNWNMTQQIHTFMNQSEMTPNRSFGMTTHIHLTGITDKVAITIESKDLEVYGDEMKDIVVRMEELGISLKLPLSNWQALMGDYETLRLTVERNDEDWNIKIMSETEGIVDVLNENIYLIFHGIAIDDTSAIRITSKEEIPLAGNYDRSEKGLLIGINKAGTYRLKTKEISYSDISELEKSLQEAIIDLTQSGIVNQESEVDQNRFRPDDYITRGEFATMIINAFYLYDEELIPSFKDIAPSDWYYHHIGSSEAVLLIQDLLSRLY